MSRLAVGRESRISGEATIHILCELQIVGDSLTGRAIRYGGDTREFTGWLGLLGALQDLVADNWSDANGSPASIPAEPGAMFMVRGMSPGMVAAYQIYDAARAATGSWIGAKLYTPKDLADPNSWECRLYFGAPIGPRPLAGHGDHRRAAVRASAVTVGAFGCRVCW